MTASSPASRAVVKPEVTSAGVKYSPRSTRSTWARNGAISAPSRSITVAIRRYHWANAAQRSRQGAGGGGSTAGGGSGAAGAAGTGATGPGSASGVPASRS